MIFLVLENMVMMIVVITIIDVVIIFIYLDGLDQVRPHRTSPGSERGGLRPGARTSWLACLRSK